MDDFITHSIKYGTLSPAAFGPVITVVSVAISVLLFFGVFLAMCAAAFVAGAIINTVVIVSGKLKSRRSASEPES